MPTYLLVILLLFVLILVWGVVMNQKKKDVAIGEETKIAQSGIVLTKKSTVYQGIIGIDEQNRKLVMIKNTFNKGSSNTIGFEDIAECELIKDGVTVYKKSAARTIGGAIIGGALAGGVGAIIGGLSGGSTGSEVIKKIELKLIVRDSSNTTHRFVFYDSTADNPIQLKERIQQAEMWKDTVSGIIDQETSPKQKAV
jgi:hypothetical protein